MVTVMLVAAAIAWAVAAAVATAPGRTAVRVSSWLSALGGVTCAIGGGSLAMAGHPVVFRVGSGQLVGTLSLVGRPLAGVFVALLGVVALAIGLYAPRYHHPGSATKTYLCGYNLAVLASLAVLLAGNAPTFLVAWESMALLSYFLVLRHHREPGVADGGFWFLALSEVGFAMIIAAFAILCTQAGSLDLATIAARSSDIPIGWRSAAYVLALVGFGFKAGLVPMHVWLPEAHPVAPADGSAFLSGLVVKLGVYGIVLFAFYLLGPGPVWCGVLTMGIGAISAVLGVLYALTERDLKRFLAYSTIENVGIVITSVGAAMVFVADHQPVLGGFLLVAALFHVASHGVSKSLLFLSAGVVDHATGTLDADRLGGLVRLLPRTTVITAVGVVGIAALPPFGGFVSEWLVFEGMFQAFRLHSHLIGVLVVAAAAMLGLTGGLAVAAFIRYFGIAFLGMPRTHAVAGAREDGQPTAGPAVLAVLTVGLGVGAPLLLRALAQVIQACLGVNLRPSLLVGDLTVIPARTNFSAFSPTYLAVCLLAMLAVPIVIYLCGRPRGPQVDVPVWDGGIRSFKPRMQYSAMTFSAPMRVTFSGLYRPTVDLARASDDPAGRSGPVHYESTVSPLFMRYLYQPVIAALRWLADLARPIQSGDVNLYLLYVFIAVLVVWAVAAG